MLENAKGDLETPSIVIRDFSSFFSISRVCPFPLPAELNVTAAPVLLVANLNSLLLTLIA